MKFERKAVSGLLRFMQERQRIYERRARGDAPPWTRDPILQTYRFCNVYRELDTVTQWIDANVRRPYARDPDLWFMLCLSRVFNKPESLAELIASPAGWPRDGRWSEASYWAVIRRRRAAGLRYTNPAYIPLGFIKRMGELWSNRVQARRNIEAAHTMEAMHGVLTQHRGIGKFLAYEIVCDMRFTRYLRDAQDKLTWTNPGPGSMRGLSRMCGRPLAYRWRPEEFVGMCTELLYRIGKLWPEPSALHPRLELREIEHSLCEYDKWLRASTGDGRPKQKYKPKSNREE